VPAACRRALSAVRSSGPGASMRWLLMRSCFRRSHPDCYARRRRLFHERKITCRPLTFSLRRFRQAPPVRGTNYAVLGTQLIFLGAEDTRAEWESLRERGLPVVFADVNEYLSGLCVHFREGRMGVAGLRNLLADEIWYNVGSFEQLEQGWFIRPGGGRFRARQLSAVLGMFETLIADQCVDQPVLLRKWSNKLVQLHALSSSSSWLLPETWAMGTLSGVEAGQLVKHVGESRWIDEDRAFYCQVATEELIVAATEGDDQFPVLVQDRLEADFEYRSFVFGREEATIRFASARESLIPDLQFHPEAVSGAEVVPSPVDGGVWEELRRILDLSIFSVDYMMQGDKLYLLEVNPVFGWAWLPAPCIDAVVMSLSKYLTSDASG
jgi:hypothetical protein